MSSNTFAQRFCAAGGLIFFGRQNSYHAYSGKVSASILMVACWISHVIEEGQGCGKHHRPYAKKTAQSYFSTLRLVFQGIAYSCELLSMDFDAITDLYHDMVESRRDREKEVGYFGKRIQTTFII
ncbi:hypothetical protein AB4876_18700 [Zhongshania guokunii]|uniref:Uncharacterized protein n=1 Tax=Zhongshania guokunii TaxID=641783 RepID=A0ABV3UEU5_9GAMM